MIGKEVAKFKDYQKKHPQQFTAQSSSMLRLIGDHVVQIMFIKAAMANRILNNDSAQFIHCSKKLYTKIKQLDKASKQDIKQTVGYYEFQNNQDVLRKIANYIQEQVFQQLLKQFEPFTLDQDSSDSVGKPNWLTSTIQDNFNKSSFISQLDISSGMFKNQTKAKQLSEADTSKSSVKSNVQFEIMDSINPQSNPDLNQYFSKIQNAKIELNHFHQQMKLELPQFSKTQVVGGWKGTCVIKTANKFFDTYKREVYMGESVNMNSKVAETEAASIALKHLYQENPDIWRKFKAIKAKMGLP